MVSNILTIPHFKDPSEQFSASLQDVRIDIGISLPGLVVLPDKETPVMAPGNSTTIALALKQCGENGKEANTTA